MYFLAIGQTDLWHHSACAISHYLWWQCQGLCQ